MMRKRKFEVGDRVRSDMDFLSDGTVKKCMPEAGYYVVLLDEKAPNEYAWETREVLLAEEELELVND